MQAIYGSEGLPYPWPEELHLSIGSAVTPSVGSSLLADRLEIVRFALQVTFDPPRLEEPEGLPRLTQNVKPPATAAQNGSDMA